MTSSKSTQKITDKLEQKNEHLEHKDVKIHFEPWGDKCKFHAFSFESAENSDSNSTFINPKNISSNGFVSEIIHAYTFTNTFDSHQQHLECDFSTSTNTSITASQIILLDAMKKYFKYKVTFLCGIPKVTLDGTLEDWLHLQEKVAKIRDLGLELDFWLDRLSLNLSPPIRETMMKNSGAWLFSMFLTVVMAKRLLIGIDSSELVHVPFDLFMSGILWNDIHKL
ncbi:hypothetical protein Glove_132g225 [Diversispora epigaea]|uniref:Uncharacterized protein n=1 Tax=Diversispora epigaea TaxID=1348612 RepID=A0A397J1L8_9GLOM|nr:hypothetical protein Glove_132g225 [Diversispora epigaea]